MAICMLNLIANDYNNSGQSTKRQRSKKNIHTINLKLINLHYLFFFFFFIFITASNVHVFSLFFNIYTCDQDDLKQFLKWMDLKMAENQGADHVKVIESMRITRKYWKFLWNHMWWHILKVMTHWKLFHSDGKCNSSSDLPPAENPAYFTYLCFSAFWIKFILRLLNHVNGFVFHFSLFYIFFVVGFFFLH